MSESTNPELKQKAAQLVSEAWEQAMNNGVPKEIMASTAFTAALTTLSELYGNEVAANIAVKLAEKARNGVFNQSE